jgi:trans-2,3-dihydro-3-hydroxyanthranilate isomerase
VQRRFVTLDVFTERRFAGNPLAVVRDTGDLDDAAMQAIAREFNLPETVFVFPPADAKSAAKLRIFTPAVELPFAGHPTVGAAVLLGRCDRAGETRAIVLEENIGAVRCHVETLDAARGRARFAVPKLPEEIAPFAGAPDEIAAALGLSTRDIGFDNFRLSRWSAGLAFTFVPVRSLDAIARARPDPGPFEDVFAQGERGRAYLFCGQTIEPDHDYHVRMFAPAMGIPEDPATGSAAAAFTGLLAAGGQLGDGDHNLRIEQGYEMGRPSLIDLGLSLRKGALVAATIGGAAVIVSDGTIEA